MNERLDEGTRSRIGTLKEQLKSERDPNTRDMIFSELGDVYMAVEGYDLIEEAEILLDSPAADAIGNSETWQDALRLQRDGYEPQSFTGIACPLLMLHGSSDPHPGKMTRDVLRRFIPQIEYVEFDRCGHEPWKERHARDAFLSNLEGWLKRTIRGR